MMSIGDDPARCLDRQRWQAVARVVLLILLGVVPQLATPQDTIPPPVAAPAAADGSVPVQAPLEPVKAARPRLREVLKALEEQHGVGIVDPWGVTEGVESPADVTGLSLENALRIVLRDYEVLMYYPAAGATGPTRLLNVWVFPRGRLERRVLDEQMGPGPAQQLASSDPTRRIAAIEEILDRDPEAAQSAMVQGLQDPDENVRYRTLMAASGRGIPLPKDPLAYVLQYDASETVRSAALDALLMNPEFDPDALRALVELAARDPSSLVRTKALELRETLIAPGGGDAASDLPDASQAGQPAGAGLAFPGDGPLSPAFPTQ